MKRHVETEGHRNAVVDAKQTGRQVRLSEMRYPPRARTSAFIHYVMLLHKYIELPILYKYFCIFYCESEIKYSENVYSKIMSQGKRGHRIAQIAAFAI